MTGLSRIRCGRGQNVAPRVGDAHRRLAVRDEHDGTPLGRVADRPENHRLVERIQPARRLIEHHEGCVAQEHARQADALALPAGQVGGILVDRHVESVGLRAHEVGDVGAFQRLPHHRIVVRRAVAGHIIVVASRQRHREIVAQRTGEQGERREHRVEQLRQEQFEERLDLFDVLAGGLHDVGSRQRIGGTWGGRFVADGLRLRSRGGWFAADGDNPQNTTP